MIMKGRYFLIISVFALLLTGCGRLMDEQVKPTSDGNYEVREMCVVREGLSIYGNIYFPAVEDVKFPAVILSHSANMTSDSMKSYCERIAAQGYVAYAFDFCGGSKNSRSDGDKDEMTVFTEVEDLKAVLKAVSELEYVDSQNIYLFGTSQGGLVSALTAAECPSAVKGLILFYPAFNISEIVQKYGTLLPGASDRPFISTLLDFDVYESIKPFEGDVLILHGTKDFIVPYSYSEKAAEIYENCEFHLIDGANHGFNKENYGFFGDFDEVTWSYVEIFLARNNRY